MDREYILNLPEGEEINNLVAEKVMGWHKGVITFSDGSTFSGKEDWLDEKGRYMCGMKTDDRWYEDEEDFNLLHWHPSESILWAWEVVEKLQDKFSFVLSYDDPPSDDEHKWNCEFFYKGDPAYIDHEVYAPTAPLAICRVALLCVMGI